MATRFKSLKSTFLFLFIIVFLYTWKAQAVELTPATKAQLHQIIGKLENAGAQVGLEIDDLGTVKNPQQFPAKSTSAPKVLFSYRAKQSYMSASNWKLFTAFYALSHAPEFTLDKQHGGLTDFVALEPIKDGVIKGNLYLIGGYDPSLDVEKIREAVARLRNIWGLREIDGDIIGQGSWFETKALEERYPFGWTLDDSLWYYAPPISALGINRNQVDVTITGGEKPGDPATVTYSPDLPEVQINAHVLTGTKELEKKSDDELLQWDRFEEGKNGFFVSGQVAPHQRITQGIPLSNPELTVAKVLLHELQDAGVDVKGQARKGIMQSSIQAIVESIPTPSLKVLLTRMLKRSDNFYAEMILRSMGDPQLTSMPEIRPELFSLLKKNGINTSGLRMEDGSGLSRYTLITPNAMTQLLNAVQKLPSEKGDIFWNALPIASVDGTLGKRMKSTFAQNNVRAKTGTFSTACNLSGYVTTRDGHRLAVSFLTNFGPDTDICRAAQDQAFELLAAGKLQ